MANLRNRSGFWMEATLAFSETNEKGITKEVKERYVVEAASFIDGEKKLRDELNYANRPIKSVAGMVRPKYGTICLVTMPWLKVTTKSRLSLRKRLKSRPAKAVSAPRPRLSVTSIWYRLQATRPHERQLSKRSIRTPMQTMRLPTL